MRQNSGIVTRGRQAGARRGPGHRRRVRKIGKGAGMTRPGRHTCCALRLSTRHYRAAVGYRGSAAGPPSGSSKTEAFEDIEKASEHGAKIRGDGPADEGRWRQRGDDRQVRRRGGGRRQRVPPRQGRHGDRGATGVEKIPEHIRRLLLANAFCHNCGTTEFAPGYTLRMRHDRVLVEGCCAKCGAKIARLCD